MIGLDVSAYIVRFAASPLAGFDLPPWRLTELAPKLIAEFVARIGDGYRTEGGVAIHREARIEPGAVVKAPAIVGRGCFLASGAYLRGGCWLEEDCVVGPGAEVKSSYLFRGAKLAHFNFVGDSLVGADSNLEAGAILANHRNERPSATIVLTVDGNRVETGATKFGALVGDGTRIGANAVIAPGAVLPPRSLVPRLGLVDQDAG